MLTLSDVYGFYFDCFLKTRTTDNILLNYLYFSKIKNYHNDHKVPKYNEHNWITCNLLIKQLWTTFWPPADVPVRHIIQNITIYVCSSSPYTCCTLKSKESGFTFLTSERCRRTTLVADFHTWVHKFSYLHSILHFISGHNDSSKHKVSSFINIYYLRLMKSFVFMLLHCLRFPFSNSITRTSVKYKVNSSVAGFPIWC